MDLQWSYTLILSLLISQTGALSGQPCPKYCLCNKSNFTMHCDGKHGELRYIPRPPKYVSYFQLTDTNLGHMTKADMVNLTNCNVTQLRLVNNKINSISPDAMGDLKHLKILHLEQTYFPISEFCLALQQMTSCLTNISIVAETLDTKTVSASSFQHHAGLLSLSLQLNEMQIFNTTGLQFMNNLTNLILDDNCLYIFSIAEVVPNLTELSLRENDLDTIPMLCSDTHTPLLPKLSRLNLQYNTIKNINTSGISCLEHLQTVVLDQNRIEHLHDNVFARLPVLRVLYLSSMHCLRSIDELAFNSSSLMKLQLNENRKLIANKFTTKTLFQHARNLRILDMSNTILKLKPQDMKELLLSLKNIRYLKLTKTSIFTLPSGVFSQLTKLTKLILSGNDFESWDKQVFANVTSIKHIYLDGNNIKIINESSFPLEFRLSMNTINLANNPFICTCDQLWFRNWMKEVVANKSIIFKQYPGHYKCRFPVNNLPLDEYNPTFKSCTIHQLFFVYLVISLSVCIAFTVASLVTYRYRWYILYWISLMRRRQRPCSVVDMQYDGFVSYSNPDWDWVSVELMDFLEGELGLRLCEHSRDFMPGMYIVDNVIEAIDTSKKTILVISNEYMKSDWCQFELQMALSSFLKKEIDIVVILLEQIKSCNVTSSLRALMMSTTYIEWSDEAEAKRLFKTKLKNAMTETI